MRKENKRLNLDHASDASLATPAEEFEKLDLESGEEDAADVADAAIDYSVREDEEEDGVGSGKSTSNNEDIDARTGEEETSELQKAAKSPYDSSDMDDEYGSREDVENRLLGSLPQPQDAKTTSVASDVDGVPQQKLGKAKARRAKKAARQEQEAQRGQEASFDKTTCNLVQMLMARSLNVLHALNLFLRRRSSSIISKN